MEDNNNNQSGGVIISDNTKGNPYHEAGSGKFTEKENAGVGQSDNETKSKSVKGSKLLSVFGVSSDNNVSSSKNKLFSAVNSYVSAEDNELEELFNVLNNNGVATIDDLPDVDDYGYEKTEENIGIVVDSFSNNELYNEIITDYTIDKDKVKNLTDEEYKEIIKAQAIVQQGADYSSLDKYNQETYEGLWINPVKPSDYENKKFAIAAKLDYFENIYNKEDKQDKIDALQDFVKKGELYLSEKQKLDETVQTAQDLLNKYSNWEERKNNATWIGGPMDFDNMTGAINKAKDKFGHIYEKAYKLFGANSPEVKYSEEYTWHYSNINEPLLKVQYVGTEKEFTKKVSSITNFIDKSELEFDCWVERGLDKIIDNVAGININGNISDGDLSKLVGKTFTHYNFASTAVAKGHSFNGDIKMYIFCPKGTKGAFLGAVSGYQHETELLLQRGYSYKITKTYRKNGTVCMDCEVILGSDKNKYNEKELKELSDKYILHH